MSPYPALPITLAGGSSVLALASPSPVYLTGEEALRLTSVGNAAGVTLQVSGRILRPDNTISPFTFTQTPNSNRTALTTIQNLSEGWLLAFEVKPTAGAPAGGAVWVLVELVRGAGSTAIALQALGSDFVTLNAPLMWPNGINVDPLDGAGCLRSIAGTTPAAGAEISESVPTAARWELLSIVATFVTSAVVANRVPALSLEDGTAPFGVFPVGVPLAASLNVTVSWGQALTAPANGQSANILGAFPVGVRLGAGFRIKTNTAFLQAADQFSAVRYLVREWFDV